MNAFCIALGVIFLGMALGLALGKVHTHIDAWKKMPQEEKEKIRILPLCRNIAVMFAICGFICLLAGLFPTFLEKEFIWCMIAWFVLSGLDVWYIQRKGHYVIEKNTLPKTRQ